MIRTEIRVIEDALVTVIRDDGLTFLQVAYEDGVTAVELDAAQREALVEALRA